MSLIPTDATIEAILQYIDDKLERHWMLPLDVDGFAPVRRVELRDSQVFTRDNETRTFSILPLDNFTSKHITIDTGSVRPASGLTGTSRENFALHTNTLFKTGRL